MTITLPDFVLLLTQNTPLVIITAYPGSDPC